MADEDEKVLLRRFVILIGMDLPLVAHVLQCFIDGRPAAGMIQVKVESRNGDRTASPATAMDQDVSRSLDRVGLFLREFLVKHGID